MRKVSFALAIGFVLAACGGGEENQPPKTPEAPPVATTPAPAPTAEAPKEEAKPKESLADLQQKTAKGFVEAANAHDAKKVAGFYAESAVLKMSGNPDATGREAVAQSYQKVFDAFKDYTIAPTRVFMKGDLVVSEWTFNGTHTGDLWGIKATEKKAGFQGVDIAWFTPEGQIKEHHIYFDGATMLSQLGVSKQKARPVPALPSGPPQAVPSTGSADEAKNTDVAKAMMGAVDAKKEADFLATMADTVEWDDMTQPQASKGKADAKKFLKEMTTGFPDVKTTINNAWAFGDFVVVESSWTGTHKGAFFGIPATKKTVNARGVDVIQLKDGKIVKGWGYSNGADFAQQLGLMPKPADAKAGDAKAGDKKPADTKAAPAGDKKPADTKAAPAGDKKPADTKAATPAKK